MAQANAAGGAALLAPRPPPGACVPWRRRRSTGAVARRAAAAASGVGSPGDEGEARRLYGEAVALFEQALKWPGDDYDVRRVCRTRPPAARPCSAIKSASRSLQYCARRRTTTSRAAARPRRREALDAPRRRSRSVLMISIRAGRATRRYEATSTGWWRGSSPRALQDVSFPEPRARPGAEPGRRAVARRRAAHAPTLGGKTKKKSARRCRAAVQTLRRADGRHQEGHLPVGRHHHLKDDARRSGGGRALRLFLTRVNPYAYRARYMSWDTAGGPCPVVSPLILSHFFINSHEVARGDRTRRRKSHQCPCARCVHALLSADVLIVRLARALPSNLRIAPVNSNMTFSVANEPCCAMRLCLGSVRSCTTVLRSRFHPREWATSCSSACRSEGLAWWNAPEAITIQVSIDTRLPQSYYLQSTAGDPAARLRRGISTL